MAIADPIPEFSRPPARTGFALLVVMAPMASNQLEGLLAKVALRNNVTLYALALQVLFFHVLCIVDLWLLDGGLGHLFSAVGHLFGVA